MEDVKHSGDITANPIRGKSTVTSLIASPQGEAL